jgi:hypothetical protein
VRGGKIVREIEGDQQLTPNRRPSAGGGFRCRPMPLAGALTSSGFGRCQRSCGTPYRG